MFSASFTLFIVHQTNFVISHLIAYLSVTQIIEYNQNYMSRLQPYRSRIPTHIIQLLDVASRITLFLVGQSGPLSFTFKDRLDNKYKTSIGPELKCSCSPGRNDHCIHTAYIFLKIFRVSVDNPIIWQNAYVDSELSDLLSWKHTMPQARRPRPTFELPEFESLPVLPSQLIKRKEKPSFKAVVLSERMKLQADSVCPICQEPMTSEMCLSYCKVQCGNNFHLECLKVWARHRVQEDSKVNCPMCRSPFPSTIIQELDQEQKQWAVKESQKIRIQFDCSSCGLQNIPNNPHKCLLCTSFHLCECCYDAKKHVKHPFVRRDPDGRWRGAEQRREDELKLKNYIDSKRKETYNDDILKKLRKIDQDPSKLLDYVASAYPYVSRYITEKIDPMKKMDFEPSDIKCIKCGATRMLFLRRLTCGHFIDHQCLKNSILKQKFYCQEDGCQFLKGYENLRQKEKEIQQKRNHQMINLAPVQFDPSPMQRAREIVAETQESASLDLNFNFIRNNAPQNLNQILSSREPPVPSQSIRVGQRLTSNLIHESSHQSREREHQQIRRPPIQRNAPKSRERQLPPRPSDIRIRNVSNSSYKSVVNERKTRPLNRSEKKDKRQQMGMMIEALIGRKLK